MAIYKNGVKINEQKKVSLGDFVLKVEKMVVDSNHVVHRDIDVEIEVNRCYDILNYEKAVQAYIDNEQYYR